MKISACFAKAGKLLLFFFCLPQTLAGQDLEKSGTVFQVNPLTIYNQKNPVVAMDTAGNYVIAFESDKTESDEHEIYARTYASDGTPDMGGEKLNQIGGADQRSPDIAMAPNGNFFFTYMGYNMDTDGWGILYNKFSSDLSSMGPESVANFTTAGNQRDPSVAVDQFGNACIVWTSIDMDFKIMGQRFDSAGLFSGSEFQINTNTSDYLGYPQIAMDYSGDFVVVWQNLSSDGSGHGIFGQRYNSSGVAQGSEFQVNTTTGHQLEPEVAMDSAGNFLVVWTSQNQDGDGEGVYAQRYNSSGVAQGSEFLVNTTTTDDQNHPHVTTTESGQFIITWTSHGQDGSLSGVFYNTYASDGSPIGTETIVNSTTTNAQLNSSAAMRNSDGTLVIAWQDGLPNSTSTLDGDDFGIFGQAFTDSGGTPLPIELLSFDAWAQENQTALLEWVTAVEINNSGFEVERLEGANSWIKIGWVPGVGNSSEVQEYHFIDPEPQLGSNYYRLKQIDFDGKYEYTEIKEVYFSNTPGSILSIYPNPVRDRLFLKISGSPEEWIECEIVNMQGQSVITSQQLSTTHAGIKVSHLPAGVYFLKTVMSGETSTFRFVKL